MRIGIYNQPAGGRPGGSEYAVAALAGPLARAYQPQLGHSCSLDEGIATCTGDIVALRHVLTATPGRWS